MLNLLKSIFIFFIIILNFGFIFLNEEFIIVLSLIIFFSLLLFYSKKAFILFFMHKIEFIYFHFFYLISLELILCEKLLSFLVLKEFKFFHLTLVEIYGNFVCKMNLFIEEFYNLQFIWYKLKCLVILNELKNLKLYALKNLYINEISNSIFLIKFINKIYKL